MDKRVSPCTRWKESPATAPRATRLAPSVSRVAVVDVLAVTRRIKPFSAPDLKRTNPWLFEISDATHPAEETVITDAVRSVSCPAVVPVTADKASKTGDINVLAGTPGEVLAPIVVVTNPTGSVVAVVWPMASVSRRDETRSAAREKL